MKKLLLGALALTTLAAAPAVAADLGARPYTRALPMIPTPIYDWSGFYIGINGGGGSTHNCWDLVSFAAVPPAPVITPATLVAEGCQNASGGTVGGQIGYRWQAASWVFGLEGQGNWADFKSSNLNTLAGTIFIPGLTDETKVDAFGLLTGQIGYAWNNVLWYVKGGGAVVRDKYRTFITPAGTLIDSANETRWGGTIGTGVEIGFAPNWSVGVEYNHLFMSDRNITAVTPAGLFSATDRISQDVDIGLVRLNYRFGWGSPVVARY